MNTVGTSSFQIVRVPYDHRDAQMLIEKLQAVYVERYGGRDDDELAPEMFEPPAGSFFVGYAGDVPAASGAWRRTDGSKAELKRLYVVPEWNRRGLARQMLARLEGSALDAGCDQVILSTGPRQPEAIALYRSAGYTDVGPFGYYGDHATELVTFLGKNLN